MFLWIYPCLLFLVFIITKISLEINSNHVLVESDFERLYIPYMLCIVDESFFIIYIIISILCLVLFIKYKRNSDFIYFAGFIGFMVFLSMVNYKVLFAIILIFCLLFFLCFYLAVIKLCYSSKSESNSTSGNSTTTHNERLIGYAIQEGSRVIVYDTKGLLLFSRRGELKDFSSKTVVIKEECMITVLNEKGLIIASKSASGG